MEKRYNKMYEDYNTCRIYDKVRSGEYKNFSPHFFVNGDKYHKITTIIRYYVEDVLKVTSKEAINLIDLNQIEKDKLKPLLKYLEKEKPDEYKTEKNYVSHLIYFAYPELEKPKKKDLVIQCYKEVLEGKRKTFPKNYFKNFNGEERAKICFEYLRTEILKIEVNELSNIFLESNEKGLDLLKTYKLKILTQMLYYSVSDMIENLYPELNLKGHNKEGRSFS